MRALRSLKRFWAEKRSVQTFVENTKRVRTSGQLVIDVRILFGGHTEQGGDAVSVRVPVREAAHAPWGIWFRKRGHGCGLEGESSKLDGDWYMSTERYKSFCSLAKAKEGGSGEYDT